MILEKILVCLAESRGSLGLVSCINFESFSPTIAMASPPLGQLIRPPETWLVYEPIGFLIFVYNFYDSVL